MTIFFLNYLELSFFLIFIILIIKETCYVNSGFNMTPDSSPTTTQSPSSLSSSPSMSCETATTTLNRQTNTTKSNDQSNTTNNSNANNYVNESLLLLHLNTNSSSTNKTSHTKTSKYTLNNGPPSSHPQSTTGKTSKFHSIKMLPQYLLNNSKIKQLISHNNNNNNTKNGTSSILHLSTPDLYNTSSLGMLIK